MLIALTLLMISTGSAGTTGIVQVNIYGDGNFDNGIEDSRKQVFGGQDTSLDGSARNLNAGTIVCAGKIRGTAMVVDTSGFVSRLSGVVILTAAHVLYDLRKKTRFRHCEFNFMGFTRLNNYRARVDFKYMKMGLFNPQTAPEKPEFGEGDWVFLYLPRPWKSYNPAGVIALHVFPFSNKQMFHEAGGKFRLIGFNSSTKKISISESCNVIESNADDLGGGAWKGQLLDDCDSGDGASGGGIIALMDNQPYLVGIRSGSHWSDEIFPLKEYPQGPPAGALWSRYSNTNFGRAIDAHLLLELGTFIQKLDARESRF